MSTPYLYFVSLFHRPGNEAGVEYLGIFDDVGVAHAVGVTAELEVGEPAVATVERYERNRAYFELTDPVLNETYYEVRNGIPAGWT